METPGGAIIVSGGRPAWYGKLIDLLWSPPVLLGDGSDRSIDGVLRRIGSRRGASISDLTWVCLVPASSDRDSGPGEDATGETLLLEQTLGLAEEVSLATEMHLVFLFLLPVSGLYSRRRNVECEVASAVAVSLMRDKVVEWAERGSRVLAVAYGALDGCEDEGRRGVDELRSRIPMGRLGSVRELAGTIEFLASEKANYITGSTVRVDGGWHAYSWMYPVRDY